MIITQILFVYMVAIFIVGAKGGESFREWMRRKVPGFSVGGQHVVDCRFCTGFWLSLIAVAVIGNLGDFFWVWGISYFITTLER